MTTNSKKRDLVNLESPFAGNTELNILYARFCMHDSLVNHNEAPFASHLLYTQPHVLRDDVPRERETGISAGRDFSDMTQKTVMYLDLGISSGMEYAMTHAKETNHPLEQRSLPDDLWEKFTSTAKRMNLSKNGELYTQE